MNVTIFVRGEARNELKKEVRNNTQRMLSRLQRHVLHAEFLLEEQDLDTGDSVHRCTLRLCLSEGGDVLVHARGGGRDAALTSALRQSRRALLRRRRAALQLSPWHIRPQPAMV